MIVSLATAKAHLKVRDSAHDADVGRTLAVAEAAILAYLKKDRSQPDDPAPWDESTAPAQVPGAICYVLALLYVHRGDDLAPDKFDAETWAAVGRLLCQLRDPALA